MIPLLRIARFEAVHQLRRPSLWIFFGLSVLWFTALAMGTADTAAAEGGTLFHAPMSVARAFMNGTLFSLLFIAAVAGEAATRDLRSRMTSLVYALPLTRFQYLGGHFLGALAITLPLTMFMPITQLVIGATEVEPHALGVPTFGAYARAWLVLVLPSTFAFTALAFAAATLTRRAVAAWAAAATAFVGTLFVMGYVAGRLNNWMLASLLDPFGANALRHARLVMSPAQMNADPLPLSTFLVGNRIVWLAVAVLALVITGLRFRFAHVAEGGRRRRRAARESFDYEAGAAAPVPLPATSASFGVRTRLTQTLLVARRSLREILRSRGAFLMLVPAVYLLLVGPELLEHIGVPYVPTAGRIFSVMANPADVFLWVAPLLAIFFAGELVWSEREAGVDSMVDAAPLPSRVLIAGKLLGLALMLFVVQALLMIGAVVLQTMLGYRGHELGLLAAGIFGLQYLDLLLLGGFAIAVHSIVNQKYVGHMLLIFAWVLRFTAPMFGIEHKLLVYGAAPGWWWSDLAGFGRSLTPYFGFQAYWLAWTALLLVVARLFWRRGPEDGWRSRIRVARARARARGAGLALASLGAIVVVTGGFVFYNTNVLNAYVDADEQAARRATYELRYGRFEGTPQPELAVTRARVDLFAERGHMRARGTHVLVNRTGAPIDTLHVATASGFETTLEPGRAARAVIEDHDLGHHAFELEQALQPGDSMTLDFTVRYAPRGFGNHGAASSILPNGSRLDAEEWVPVVGYQRIRELAGAGERIERGLPPTDPIPTLEDTAARYVLAVPGRGTVELDLIVSTDAAQTALSSGALVREWSEGGRAFFHYRTDAPIRSDWGILSAEYEVLRGRAAGVDVEVWYDADHARPAARMLRAAELSLEIFSERYGPYPYRQIRLADHAGPGSGGAHAFPGMISYSEGFALLDPERDWRDIDLQFAVVAHEIAHQWWGNQLVPAHVEGAPVLSESLAWYSAMAVVEREYGHEHLQRLLGMMRLAYLTPRARADVPLLRGTDWYHGYRKGAFAMHALREYLGEERVDGALRGLLERHAGVRPPLPTTLDLHAALREAAPDSLKGLVDDLLVRNTFWDIDVDSARADSLGDGRWRVTIHVEASKAVVDTAGAETRVPVDIWVDVGAFEEGPTGWRGDAIHVERRRITDGAQTLELIVPRQPPLVGVDPYAVLIDTNPSDNVAGVRTE